MTVRIEQVDWDDPRGVALRRALDTEVGPRSAGRIADATAQQLEARRRALAIDPATIPLVLLALDADGTPLGHAALRRLDRGRGVATRRIAAVEAAARSLGAERRVLLPATCPSGAHRCRYDAAHRPICSGGPR